MNRGRRTRWIVNTRFISAIAGLALCLSSCSSDAPAPPHVTVKGSAPGAPADCGMDHLIDQLQQLGQALSDQDLEQSISLFDADHFEWFSINQSSPSSQDRTTQTAYDLPSLRILIQDRFERNETWALQEVQVGSWDAQRNLIHFGPLVFDLSSDPEAQSNTEEDSWKTFGKGAYHCPSRSFAVLSLSLEQETK